MSIFNTGVAPFKKFKVVPIFLAITDDYAKYAAGTISSLTKHANPNRYYRIIILYDKLSLKNHWRLRNMVTRNCAIEFRQMRRSIYLQIIMRYCAKRTGSGDFYSAAVYYYRTFIARLFLQYERAIYIDSDIILTGDIGELFDIDLGENIIAARPDPKVAHNKIFINYVENALNIPAKEYVNSGVLLMDLKKLRKFHYITKMTDLIKEYDADLVAPDQDYLNTLLRGKILFLDKKWNVQFESEFTKNTKLVHFNLGRKPWFNDDVPHSDLFWDAVKNTNFYSDLLRGKEEYSLKDMENDDKKLEALLEKADRLSKLDKPIFE